MPTYVTLYNWTQQGIADYKNAPARMKAAREAMEAAGGKVHGFYITMGEYDGVVIVEAPNDEAAAKVLLATGAQGNVSTETMRAFTESEFTDLVSG